MNAGEAKTMPNYRKPDQTVPMSKFLELAAKVDALEKAIEEKRGRKPKQED